MTGCMFVSDLHGNPERYRALFGAIVESPPRAVFIGGDILPHPWRVGAHDDFIDGYLLAELARLRERLGAAYPRVFIILGNDDGRLPEPDLIAASEAGLVFYVHNARRPLDGWSVYGYSFSPPSPFRLKDWERYDVSRFVDPGSIAPEEGIHADQAGREQAASATIARDLEMLAGSGDLGRAVFLFHAPPYRTNLDRAALDGRTVDHVPLDVHVGSIAIRRFIEARQPLVTLHGHVHESARLSGSWQDRLGRTVLLSAAHDGPELALVRFELENPAAAQRELL